MQLLVTMCALGVLPTGHAIGIVAPSKFAEKPTDELQGDDDYWCGGLPCDKIPADFDDQVHHGERTRRSAFSPTPPPDMSFKCGVGYTGPSSTRVAVMLRGGTFRRGRCNTRKGAEDPFCGHTNDTALIVEEQLTATRSVLEKLVEPFVKQGFAVDVFMGTYADEGNTLVEKLLKPYLRNQTHLPPGANQAWGAMAVLNLAAAYARQNQMTYRYMVLLRHDVMLKMNIAPLIQIDRFTFPFSQAKHGNCAVDHVVPDTLQAFPMKFLGCLLEVIDNTWPGEGGLGTKLQTYVGLENMGTFTNCRGDSNPGIHVGNIVYRIAMRTEGRLENCWNDTRSCSYLRQFF